MYHIKGKNKREIHLGMQGNRITLVFIEESEENCSKCRLASEHKKKHGERQNWRDYSQY